VQAALDEARSALAVDAEDETARAALRWAEAQLRVKESAAA
jgi:hypothetical protein